MTAKQIIKKVFPNCKVAGREDLAIDYNHNYLLEHLTLTKEDYLKKVNEGYFDDGEWLSALSWINFTNWTYDCGFVIHKENITFWAKYHLTRDWVDLGPKKQEWTVFIA